MNMEQDAELSGQFRRSSFGQLCPGMPYCAGILPVHPSKGFLHGKVKVKTDIYNKKSSVWRMWDMGALFLFFCIKSESEN